MDSKGSVNSKSKIKSALTPADQAEENNLSLNESGIFIADPDKIEKDLLGRIWIPLEASHIKFALKNEQTPL